MSVDTSIKEYREIVCENPYEEIWRQLYYFTDVDSVNKKIRQKFNLADGKHEEDTKKQAQQIAYSIIQAHNYFKSASQVDVSVKPNLIYYGISSLANTVILYNNTGEFSLDFLRDKKKERHHRLQDCFDLRKDGTLQDILKGISCEIYKKPNSEEPHGHFKNFCKSVVPECVFAEVNTHIPNNRQPLVGKSLIHSEKINMEDIVSRRFDLLSILGFMSDIVQKLPDDLIFNNLCLGYIISNVYLVQESRNEEADMDNQNEYTTSNFAINRLSSEMKEYFIKLCSQNKAIKKGEESLNTIVFSYDSREELVNSHFPNMVQDLSGEIYFIYNDEEYIQELANLYICFFCTGMLCRYYPDYWMHWIEKNVGFKHLMETLCSIGIRKFPNLILNQLTQCINHFHL